MVTISFKAEETLKQKLDRIAEQKGINTSAYIKLILTQEINSELSTVTENGMTLAEELNILKIVANDKKFGPFNSVKDLKKSLES